MPPKGGNKRKAAEPVAEKEAAAPAETTSTGPRTSGRSAAKAVGAYGGPIPRAKKPKVDAEKGEDKAEDKAEEGDKPAEEKTEQTTEEKAEEPKADEPVTKVAEEVPEAAQEAAKEASEAKVETSGSVSKGAISVGDSLPLDITLSTDADTEVTVKDLVAKGAVFFLYPKANTPGCTKQACAYRDNYAAFKELNYEVYGISQDSPKSLASWKAKQNFEYTCLSDPDQKLIKALGGSKTAKSVIRSHFVVEAGGKLLLASVGVKPDASYKAALDFIKAL